MLVIVDCQYYFLSFWTLKILGIEQKWKPPNSIYVIVGHCWIINMLVHLFIATIYKSLLIKIIAGRSLIRNVHRCTTYPIIFTNTMARKTNYLIFLYVNNTNSSSVGQWATKHQLVSRNNNLLYIYRLSENNLNWVNINMPYILIENVQPPTYISDNQ